MNAQTLLTPVTRTLGSVPRRTARFLDWSTALGAVGLARRRSRLVSKILFVSAGAVVGATALLLATPESGREFRTRLGKRFGGSVGRRLGKVAGEEIGAHPVQTAKVAQKARDLLSSSS